MEIRFDARASVDSLPVRYTAAGLMIGENSIVEYWERPIQQRLAEEAVRVGSRIIEIGYGLGMCAQALAALSANTHLVIEAHFMVAATARTALLASGAQVVHGLWENELPRLKPSTFDAVVFDAYPLLGKAFDGSLAAAADLINPVLLPAARVLRTGGVLLFLDFTRSMRKSAELRQEWEKHYANSRFVNVKLDIPSGCTYAEGDSGDVVILQR